MTWDCRGFNVLAWYKERITDAEKSEFKNGLIIFILLIYKKLVDQIFSEQGNYLDILSCKNLDPT